MTTSAAGILEETSNELTRLDRPHISILEALGLLAYSDPKAFFCFEEKTSKSGSEVRAIDDEWSSPERKQKWDNAVRTILNAASVNSITLKGCRGKYHVTPMKIETTQPEDIEKNWFLNRNCTIERYFDLEQNVWTCWLTIDRSGPDRVARPSSDVADFTEVYVSRDDVKKLSDSSCHPPASSLAVVSDSSVLKSAGGRPKSPSHAAFLQEIIRHADLDSLTTRALLRTHMRDWAAQNLPEPPDDSTLRRWLQPLYPMDLPEN